MKWTKDRLNKITDSEVERMTAKDLAGVGPLLLEALNSSHPSWIINDDGSFHYDFDTPQGKIAGMLRTFTHFLGVDFGDEHLPCEICADCIYRDKKGKKIQNVVSGEGDIKVNGFYIHPCEKREELDKMDRKDFNLGSNKCPLKKTK